MKIIRTEFGAAIATPQGSLPIRQIFGIGQNYAQHAKEMGGALPERPVVFMMGAHVVKCGLSRVVGELIRRGIVTAVASNGATLIHDAEIALWGKTSEDVEASLPAGSFGWARETAEFLNSAIADGAREGHGLGEAVGRALLAAPPAHPDCSILAQSARLGVPFTVHAAIGMLPEKQRAAVMMHKYEELEYSQIAKALNCSESAVKSLLFRAYETLRARLAHMA